MPADFSSLLDTLLVVAGLVLVATGLVMFIYSKTSTQESAKPSISSSTSPIPR